MIASAQATALHVVPGGQAADDKLSFEMRDVRRMFLARNGSVVEAIGGISLGVKKGEVVAVLGPSGCGKSTLLRILAGLDTDFHGSMDWRIDKAAEAANKRLRSATVFQGDSTLPWLSVEKNLHMGLSSLSLSSDEIARRTAKYLNLVGLSAFAHAYPHELSGGMRQRVAIARALAAEPFLLLMDEPLAALDSQTRLVMQQELLDIWREANSTVIYITHDIAEAIALADRIVVLTSRPGRIKQIQNVPFPRHERVVLELKSRREFGELEKSLWSAVAEEVGQSLTSGRKED